MKNKLYGYPYLRCFYHEGTFPSEYLITFNAISFKNWCFINKKDLIRIDNLRGLVKLISADEGKEISRVIINDVGDHRLPSFIVPSEDLRYYSIKNVNRKV